MRGSIRARPNTVGLDPSHHRPGPRLRRLPGCLRDERGIRRGRNNYPARGGGRRSRALPRVGRSIQSCRGTAAGRARGPSLLRLLRGVRGAIRSSAGALRGSLGVVFVVPTRSRRYPDRGSAPPPVSRGLEAEDERWARRQPSRRRKRPDAKASGRLSLFRAPSLYPFGGPDPGRPRTGHRGCTHTPSTSRSRWAPFGARSAASSAACAPAGAAGQLAT